MLKLWLKRKRGYVVPPLDPEYDYSYEYVQAPNSTPIYAAHRDGQVHYTVYPTGIHVHPTPVSLAEAFVPPDDSRVLVGFRHKPTGYDARFCDELITLYEQTVTQDPTKGTVLYGTPLNAVPTTATVSSTYPNAAPMRLLSVSVRNGTIIEFYESHFGGSLTFSCSPATPYRDPSLLREILESLGPCDLTRGVEIGAVETTDYSALVVTVYGVPFQVVRHEPTKGFSVFHYSDTQVVKPLAECPKDELMGIAELADFEVDSFWLGAIVGEHPVEFREAVQGAVFDFLVAHLGFVERPTATPVGGAAWSTVSTDVGVFICPLFVSNSAECTMLVTTLGPSDFLNEVFDFGGKSVVVFDFVGLDVIREWCAELLAERVGGYMALLVADELAEIVDSLVYNLD